jgi:DNA modification methylase
VRLTLIHLGSNLAVLPTLAPEIVDLVFTDPPYNVGYKYAGYDDNRSTGDYLDALDDVLHECKRVLKPNGQIVVIQGDKFAAETKLMLDVCGLYFRQWCIWHYTFGVQCTRRFAKSHVHVLHATKSPCFFTFNADAVRVQSARSLVYNDPRANPKGKVPDDVMTCSRVCGTFRERLPVPNQLPEALCERFIRALTNPGDSVLDPFCGSGTIPHVANKLGRVGHGIELVPEYHKIAEERCEKLLSRKPDDIPPCPTAAIRPLACPAPT